MSFKDKIKIIGLKEIPLIKKGDNISDIIIKALDRNGLPLQDGDIIVIAQTIISKSSGRTRNLNEIVPSEKALEIYKSIMPKTKLHGLPEKKPQLIQAILDESEQIIKSQHVLITETNHGFICADAGIDKSNVEGEGIVTLLPKNPDNEAEKIRITLKNKTKKEIAIIISDSFGRPFRLGAIGTAIGVSGINPILDVRGKKDLFGYELQTTIIGQVDSIAAAAQLVMGESDEGIPIVLIRGYNFEFNEKTSIKSILRKKEIDIFRDNEVNMINKLLKNRRSYKLPFAPRIVDKKIIEECIELARWAPSAHNGQFWRYTILERDKTRVNLIDKMNEKLRNDLQKNGKSKEFIKLKIEGTRNNFVKAPILIILCLDSLDLEKYPDPERTQNEFILGIQSISSSATYLLLAFEMKKLAACWYCAPIFAKDIIKESLQLPDTYIPMAFFTVGYPLKAVKAPNRKELKDILFEPII
ncbi:MAG: coenzyme F420-0:L-glutamate ligase [Promethearchaeota archaeon Loki_b32]|nr:MAG: coenzyme F420-0:L-glutamate ligase [Candidatus Lokiarchaeota archaeon Loki_b32]